MKKNVLISLLAIALFLPITSFASTGTYIASSIESENAARTSCYEAGRIWDFFKKRCY